MRSWLWDKLDIGFINHFAEGESINSFPDPKFKPAGYFNDPKNRVITSEHDILPWFTSDYLFSKVIEIAYGLEYDWDFIETQNKIAEV